MSHICFEFSFLFRGCVLQLFWGFLAEHPLGVNSQSVTSTTGCAVVRVVRRGPFIPPGSNLLREGRRVLVTLWIGAQYTLPRINPSSAFLVLVCSYVTCP